MFHPRHGKNKESVKKMSERLYTAKELAEILKCDPQTIYRMADRGEIEDVKVGKLRRFLMPDRGDKTNEKDKPEG